MTDLRRTKEDEEDFIRLVSNGTGRIVICRDYNEFV